MEQARRWLPLAVAVLATALLATGFGLAAGQLASPHAPAPPRLKTVSAATLSHLGIRLSAPTQPIYCGVAGAVGRGWADFGKVGCAIPQGAAAAAATQRGSAQFVEGVLAGVGSSRALAVGRDVLAWVVVTRHTAPACPRRPGEHRACAGGRAGATWNQLVVVDARSAGILTIMGLGPAGAGRNVPGRA